MTESVNVKDLFASMNKVDVATDENVATPMTTEQVAKLKKILREEHAVNVYPNSFNVKKPYRVSIRYNGEFTNYGNFSNKNVAKTIGNIISMSVFGEKALASQVNQDAAMAHQEFMDWVADDRNQDVLRRASGSNPLPEAEEVPF